MAFTSLSCLDALVLAIAFGCSLFLRWRRRVRVPYPPGPKGIPLLGNLFDVPATHQWLGFIELGKQYASPVIHLNMAGMHIVVVNDHDVLRNVFEKRASRYADRPRFVLLNEIMEMTWSFSHSPYSDTWKTCRRMADTYFKESEARKLRPLEVAKVHMLLKNILESPEDVFDHIRYHSLAIILDVAFGLNSYEDRQFADLADDVLREISAVARDKEFVEALPWLKYIPTWFPGMKWKRDALLARDRGHKLRDGPLETVKMRIREGTAKPSIASQLLETEGNREEVIKCMFGGVIGGAFDTSVSLLNYLFFLMLLFPDVQARAHEELDRVIGPGRLPEFADMDDLPYIRAICKEIIRWSCPGPVGLPHASMEDDIWEFEGNSYFIPKGSMVIGNLWAFTHDPSVYPKPNDFDPSRFVACKEDGSQVWNTEMKDPSEIVFGFRSRHCPGRFMAEDTLFISVASILHVFRTEHVQGGVSESWRPADVDKLLDFGFILRPLPFECKIVSRGGKGAAVELVKLANL